MRTVPGPRAKRRIALRRGMTLATACLLVAVLSLRCSTLTELFIVVDSDLDIGVRVDAIRITVEGSGETLTREGALGPGGWPATLGVQAGEDEQATVTITATALKGGVPVATTTVRTAFVPEESRAVPVAICASCVGKTCAPNQRCDRGACVDALLPAGSLPPFGIEVRAQCGGDPSIDGGSSRDSGGDAPSSSRDAPPGDGPVDALPAKPPCNGALDCERVVFVTSQPSNGNLGGLLGGDARCQSLADASPLARVKGHSFRAWLSTRMEGPPTSAADRLPHGTQPYVLVDGTRIAASWSSLVDGALDAPIARDERGQLVAASSRVWTGTDPSGLATPDLAGTSIDCGRWTSASGTDGSVGVATSTSGAWTSAGEASCDQSAHLYCIEL